MEKTYGVARQADTIDKLGSYTLRDRRICTSLGEGQICIETEPRIALPGRLSFFVFITLLFLILGAGNIALRRTFELCLLVDSRLWSRILATVIFGIRGDLKLLGSMYVEAHFKPPLNAVHTFPT